MYILEVGASIIFILFAILELAIIITQANNTNSEIKKSKYKCNLCKSVNCKYLRSESSKDIYQCNDCGNIFSAASEFNYTTWRDGDYNGKS